MAIKFDLAFCRLIAVFAVFLHLVLGSHCPIGWDGYGNSCYKVVQSVLLRGLNWENARRDCLGSGGDLVSIASQSEMNFVSNKSLWNEHYWIGLNDRRNESQFVWSDGTLYNASVYSNWHPGEPNNRTGEDCVELHRTLWNDHVCKKKFGYICEKPKGPPMHVTSVMPPVTSGLSNVYRDVVIALSCLVFVLLIAVGLLIWRLKRALMNKKEKTPEGGNSYEVEQHETPRDHHVSQGDGYLEPLEVKPSAISHYQSIHSNGASAKHGNVISNSGTDNDQYDELYLTIIP